MILFVLSVHQKCLKQVTFHNELALAFLSVMGCKQRMMTDHHAAAVDLTHMEIVNTFGLLTPNHLKLHLTAVFSEVWNTCWVETQDFLDVKGLHHPVHFLPFFPFFSLFWPATLILFLAVRRH